MFQLKCGTILFPPFFNARGVARAAAAAAAAASSSLALAALDTAYNIETPLISQTFSERAPHLFIENILVSPHTTPRPTFRHAR